jgi:hypothetical protein
MECSSDQHGRMACTCDGLLLLRRRRRRSDRRPVRSAGGRGRRARRIPHAEPGACPATAADLPETHTPCLSPSNNSKERFDLKNINIVKIKQPTNLYKVSFKGTKLAILGALRCSRPLSTSPSSPRPARHRRQISSMRALDWSMMCRAVVPCRHRGHLAAIHLSSTNLAAIHLSSTLPSVLHLSGGETRGVAVGRPPGVGRVPGAHQDLGDRLTGCPVPSRWEGGLSAGSKHGGAFCRYSASGARSARAQPEPLASGASARVPSS